MLLQCPSAIFPQLGAMVPNARMLRWFFVRNINTKLKAYCLVVTEFNANLKYKCILNGSWLKCIVIIYSTALCCFL